jgi:hypothetical protein
MDQVQNIASEMARRHAIKGNRHFWFSCSDDGSSVAMLSLPPRTPDGMVKAVRDLDTADFIKDIQGDAKKLGAAIGINDGVTLALLTQNSHGLFSVSGEVHGADPNKPPVPVAKKKAKKPSTKKSIFTK